MLPHPVQTYGLQCQHQGIAGVLDERGSAELQGGLSGEEYFVPDQTWEAWDMLIRDIVTFYREILPHTFQFLASNASYIGLTLRSNTSASILEPMVADIKSDRSTVQGLTISNKQTCWVEPAVANILHFIKKLGGRMLDGSVSSDRLVLIDQAGQCSLARTKPHSGASLIYHKDP